MKVTDCGGDAPIIFDKGLLPETLNLDMANQCNGYWDQEIIYMRNRNAFWQALKSFFVSGMARIIWKIVLCLIRLGIAIYELLKFIDKHFNS